MSRVRVQLQQGRKMHRLRAAAVLVLAGWGLPWLAPPASAGVVVPVSDVGFRPVWYEWKKTVDDQLVVLEHEGENATLWNAVPKAVSMMLLRYGEEELYNRMYAEEDELLAAYAESGQVVPDAVVARLKEMIGRYADEWSEIAWWRQEIDSGPVIVSSGGAVWLNPDQEFRMGLQLEILELLFVTSLSKEVNMSDSSLKALFLRRVRERNMVWKKRRATTPPERQQAVALPRMYGGESESTYTNSSTSSMTSSFQYAHEYTTTR